MFPSEIIFAEIQEIRHHDVTATYLNGINTFSVHFRGEISCFFIVFMA